MRLFYLRYFRIRPQDVQLMIQRAFGTVFEKTEPAMYQLVRKRMLRLKDQWKTQATKRFAEHVQTLISDDIMVSTNSNPQALIHFFSQKWEIESLSILFYWAKDVVDFSKCEGRSLSYFRRKWTTGLGHLFPIESELALTPGVLIFRNLCKLVC